MPMSCLARDWLSDILAEVSPSRPRAEQDQCVRDL